MKVRTRTRLATAAAALVLFGAAGCSTSEATAAPGPEMVVYKSPTCGCCTSWIEHMREHGFQVKAKDLVDVTPARHQHGVPDHLASCHTAVVEGYTIEGHVPADLVYKLLEEKPAGVVGLTIPGMPQSAPGMDIPGEPYEVLTFTRDGQTSVYARR
jgi:hypothetical protein